MAVLLMHITAAFRDDTYFICIETWLVAVACAVTQGVVVHALPRDLRPQAGIVIATICASAALVVTVLACTREMHPSPTDLGAALLLLLALMAQAHKAVSTVAKMRAEAEAAFEDGKLVGITSTLEHARRKVKELEPLAEMSLAEMKVRHKRLGDGIADRHTRDLVRALYPVSDDRDGWPPLPPMRPPEDAAQGQPAKPLILPQQPAGPEQEETARRPAVPPEPQAPAQ